MKSLVIGIDPGLSGAIAFYPINSGHCRVFDMPVSPYSAKGFVKRAVDLSALADLICKNALDAPVPCAFVERVSAFPGQGVASMFSLGMSYWGAVGVLEALGIPVVLVEPKDWKAHFRLPKDKEMSRALARRLFPGADLSHKKDHNRAEALLIAVYGRGRYLTEAK